MNKLYDDERTLLEYTSRLENVKQKLAEQLKQEFPYDGRSPNPIINIDKFSSHPRMCSESETTLSNSSSKVSTALITSKASKISNSSRKNTYKKWTNPSQTDSESHRMDIDIGDTYKNRSSDFSKVDDNKEELKMFYQKFQQKTSCSSNPQSRGQESQKNHVVPKDISEAVFERKFKGFVEKSMQSASNIRDLIDKGIDPPDGDEDIARRILRVKEFSNRFSRNYLYPLARQIDDLSKWRSLHQGSLQKLLSAYQGIYNGLQAYQNHLPTSIGDCSSDKLKMLLKHLLDICDIHYKLLPEVDDKSYKDFIITFRLNADMTLKKIDDHFSNHYSEILPSTKVVNKSKLPKQKKSKNNIQERLYMYNATSSFRKEPFWRVTAEALARDKNKNTKSRYKTAGFKHRPPIVRGRTTMSPVPQSQTKLSNKKYFSMLKKQSTHTAFNEDEIATMIQMEDEKDKYDNSDGNRREKQEEETTQSPVNLEEIVLKLLHLAVDVRKKDDNSEVNIRRNRDVEKIMDILEKLKKGGDVDSLKDVLKELQVNNYKDTLELKIIQSTESFHNESKTDIREPTVTLSDPKNSKLICNQDGDTATKNENDFIKGDDETRQAKTVAVKSASSSHQSVIEKENKNLPGPSTPFKLKKSSKSSKCLQMLPKDYAVNIIQYKIDFGKHSNKNPMYKKTAKILPWVLMANLADEILNLVLLEVTNEVEISEVIENMYQSELQFC